MQRINASNVILSDHEIKKLHPHISFSPSTYEELGWTPYTPPAPEPYVPTYAELRQQAYGSIGEQLDMLYWDSMNGTATWRDHITAVKATHPKPTPK